MKHLPLRLKLMVWSALAVALAVISSAVGMSFFVHRELMEGVDGQLRAEAQKFFDEVREHGQAFDFNRQEEIREWLPAGDPPRFAEVVLGSEVLYRSQNLGALAFPVDETGVRYGKLGTARVRFANFHGGPVTLRLAADLAEVNDLMRELAVGFLVALPVMLGIVAVGSWWVARKALAPVNAITTAAEQITAQRLDQRLPLLGVRDEIGRLTGVLNAMFDRLNGSFLQAMRFSADASHELKTPLTILRSGIEDLLRSPDLTATDQSAVADLLEQTRRLSAISESLLLLSRADAGRLQLDLRPANVSQVVAECVNDAEIMAEPRGIVIETELPDEVGARIDRGRFTQILLNLFDNAVKYNRESGRIRVRVAETNEGVRIAVANTGPGIAPEHAARIFERFFRADPLPDAEGHGLGLSLARELALGHNGDLILSRADAEWTEFEFVTPPLTCGRHEGASWEGVRRSDARVP